MTDYPKVSCIMPTANRRHFISKALYYFQRQDYPHKELIIVDDGVTPIQDLITGLPNIKYERLSNAQLVGTKRNLACNISSGEIIVHLDDDDWYASNWITHQVDILSRTNADICGLSKFYYHSPLLQKSWEYIYPAHDRTWIAGATMSYWRHYWNAHPFKDVQMGEDNRFVWDFAPKVVVHDYMQGFLAIIHGQNTTPKSTGNPRWNSVPNKIIENMLNEDTQLYTSTHFKR